MSKPQHTWKYLLDDYPPNQPMSRIMNIKNLVEYHIKNKIELPDTERHKIWSIMQNLEPIVNNERNQNKYYECLNTISEEIDNDVATDAVRTFPSTQYKQKMKDNHNGKKEPLYNVLKSYAIYNEEVQYTQGMNYLCLILLCYFTEIESFYMLDILINKFGMRHFFRKKGSFVPSYLKLFEQEVEFHLPKLHSHFIKEGIQVYMFIQGWWNTIFVYNSLPFESVITIWDFFLFDASPGMAIEVLFKLSISLLKILQSSLIDVSMSQFFEHVKQQTLSVDPLEWVKEAYFVVISEDTLSLLRELVKNYQDCEKKDSRISEYIIASSKGNLLTFSGSTTSGSSSSNLETLGNSSSNVSTLTASLSNINNQSGIIINNHSDTDSINMNHLVFITDSDEDEEGPQTTLEREQSCIIN